MLNSAAVRQVTDISAAEWCQQQMAYKLTVQLPDVRSCPAPHCWWYPCYRVQRDSNHPFHDLLSHGCEGRGSLTTLVRGLCGWRQWVRIQVWVMLKPLLLWGRRRTRGCCWTCWRRAPCAPAQHTTPCWRPRPRPSRCGHTVCDHSPSLKFLVSRAACWTACFRRLRERGRVLLERP